jgi:hypothetical protein
MRLSEYPLNTLKEVPAGAEIVSHQLMLRAGLVRQLASGLYTWLPLGVRVLRKVEAVVREEMNRAGAQEVLMPMVQPGELWRESARWDEFGPELLRFKDRHQRDFCLGPTHEEVITDLARRELKSYRQLPVNWYQIQTKFRDEIRPRFGVMRAREFIMKDAYSFHLDEACLARTYASCTRPIRASAAASACVSRGRGRHRQHRRQRLARVPRARRFGRGRDRLLRRFGLRSQRRTCAGAAAGAVAAGSRADHAANALRRPRPHHRRAHRLPRSHSRAVPEDPDRAGRGRRRPWRS